MKSIKDVEGILSELGLTHNTGVIGVGDGRHIDVTAFAVTSIELTCAGSGDWTHINVRPINTVSGSDIDLANVLGRLLQDRGYIVGIDYTPEEEEE